MQRRSLSVEMSRREWIGGLLFLPLYLFLLGPALQWAWNAVLPAAPTSLQLNFSYYIVCAAVVAVLFRRFLRGSVRVFRQAPRRTLSAVFACLGVYLVLSLGVNFVVTRIMPDFSNQNNDAVISLLDESPVLIGVMAVVLAPLVEETLFRGLVFGSLRRLNAVLAYAVTALAFSAIHLIAYLPGLSPLEALLGALQYVPATLVFCALYEYTDTICAPMLLHAAVNLLTCLFWGLRS